MGDLFLGKQLHFASIDSTNTWAKRHTEQWDPTGITCVTASEQTAGRGRLKRQWLSPPCFNIYATFCFWLSLHRQEIGHIPQVMALSAAQTLEHQGFMPTIKWPNDLLLQDKKVAGILCETLTDLEQQRRGVICGIGLNVNMPLELLTQIDRPATSLLVEAGHSFEVDDILHSLQERFVVHVNQWIKEGFGPFFPLLQKKSALKKGQKIFFHDHRERIEAQFEQLHLDGSVELRFPNGKSKIFYAGEFIQAS